MAQRGRADVMRRGLITYDGLPISSGGAHTLRANGFAAAWAHVERFLEHCTDFERPEQIIIELLEGTRIPEAFVSPLKQRFSERFSARRTRRVGAAVGHQWSVEWESFAAVLQELDLLQPLPDVPSPPPLTVNVTSAFHFVDPDTRRALPFQDPSDYPGRHAGDRTPLGTSRVFARLSTRSTLSVFFSLPFPHAGEEFLTYVEFLQRHAPFRFSGAHWKIWTPAKKRGGYVGRRFSPGMALNGPGGVR